MAKKTLPDNEYAGMPPEEAVAIASVMLDENAEETNNALALAIALRDRLENYAEDRQEPTDIALAQMLVNQLAGAPHDSIKQCLDALLARCQVAQGGAA